jgi:hypothetical protein
MPAWRRHRVGHRAVDFLDGFEIDHRPVAGGGLWTQVSDGLQLTFAYGRLASLKCWREQTTCDRPGEFSQTEELSGRVRFRQQATLPGQPSVHNFHSDGATSWTHYPAQTAAAAIFQADGATYLVDWVAESDEAAAIGAAFIERATRSL